MRQAKLAAIAVAICIMCLLGGYHMWQLLHLNSQKSMLEEKKKVRRAQRLTQQAAQDQSQPQAENALPHNVSPQPKSEIKLYSRVFDQFTDLLTKVEAEYLFPEIGSSPAMRSVLSAGGRE